MHLTMGDVVRRTGLAGLAVPVDDADAHHERAAAAGAAIDHPSLDQPHGVGEYSARDLEGHLWSFHTPLTDEGATP